MTPAAVPYDGLVSDAESEEVRRLSRTRAWAVLILPASEARIPQRTERHVGRISNEVLETRIGGVDARIPWSAATGYVASASVILLLVGTEYVPIARSFFVNEEQWQLARETVTNRVSALRSMEEPVATWRTVVLWLTLLIVVFLAWHFAQAPSAR